MAGVLVLIVLAVAVGSFAESVAGKPGSLTARSAEWARDHGGASLVAGTENLWYSHHPPPVGGRPKPGLIPSAGSPVPTAEAAAQGPGHLPAPGRIPPIATPVLPGEGIWHPAGRTVQGVPTMYEAFLRPDPVHTSLVAGVAWMDTDLLKAALYSGDYIPGYGPWALTAPVQPAAAATLSAAFNSGFRLKDAEGGYYTQGRVVAPLRPGAASVVIYKNGAITVGQWGRDVWMSAQVADVRQNLRLIVHGGVPAPGLASSYAWGATVANRVHVWRSGLGVTADGALIYVAGPGLNVSSLAGLLARAGAVRAMELDINADWVNLTAYHPVGAQVVATPATGATLLPGMSGGPGRYFMTSWNRDFFTMSTAPDSPAPTAPR